MTKPHTTLSEAVRALTIPVGDDYNYYESAAFFAGVYTAADLVAQHEAQEPVPTDLSKRLRETASCIMTEYGHAELMNKAADEIERYYGGMLNWKRTAEAQPTLAATQAGDAWISVQDRLPPRMEGRGFSENVFVVNMNSSWPHVTISECNYYEGENTWRGVNVTHWMPLPSVPTTDKKG